MFAVQLLENLDRSSARFFGLFVLSKCRLILQEPTQDQCQAKLNVRYVRQFRSQSIVQRDGLTIGVRFTFSVAKPAVDQADLGGAHRQSPDHSRHRLAIVLTNRSIVVEPRSQ